VPLKTIFAALLAAAALWFLWQREQPALAHARPAPGPVTSSLPSPVHAAWQTVSAQAGTWLPSPADSVRNEIVRKCQLDERVLYTDEACPDGFEQRPLLNGTFTVVPGVAGARSRDAQVAMDRQRLAPEPRRWLE